ncbi:MAG: hypothetical protein E7185_03300 [Erysipelotrichaceae bacterium]|nr:hypothetical protein [Erysipelotrichaceae bacterium]
MKTDISGSDRFQQQAITELGSKNILVSASAGAGKTKVLVSRIMKRVIDDGVDLERIIALTFTEAAAEEMKNRLAKELHNIRSQAETDTEKEYIDRQIVSLVNANITTIDSFCLNIIKKYCSVIGLDPATTANILSEGKRQLLQRKAYEDAIRDLNSRNPEGLMKLTVWFSQRSEDFDTLYGITEMIRSHADASVSPSEWYRRARTMYRAFTNLKQLPAEVQSAWFAMLKEQCLEILEAAGTAQERLEFLGFNDKITPEMLNALISYDNDCIRLLEEYDYECFRAKLHDMAQVKIVKGKDSRLNSCRDLIFARIDAMLACCYPQSVFAGRSQRQAEIASLLVDLCESVSQRFAELKKEYACLDFGDMERYALDILQAADGAAARRINSGIDEILVDEFQDTSTLQDTIIRTIAMDKRIFRVGDVKQSIYRFRQARPQLMRDLMKDGANYTLNLRYNYRSDEQIIRFTNLLFERLMNIEGTRDSYLDEDHVSAGLDTQKNTSDACVELALLEKPDAELTAKGEKKKMRMAEAKYIKSSWIASRILEMMRNDPDLAFHDFAVLTRSHADQIALRTQFDRYGIPYDIDAREGFYRSDLCRDILAMLKYMQDQDDDLSLLSILTSPMYGFSDEEIANMILHGHRKLCQAVRILHPEITERFVRFNETARHQGPGALLGAVMNADVDGTPFYESLPPKDQANFDYLFDKVSGSDILTVTELIDEIEAGSEEKSSEAVTSGKDDDVVTVTTIHHSKGLQYRIVFLWGTSTNRDRSSSARLIADDELMIGFDDVDPDTRIVLPTIQRLCISYRESREDLEEFNRLLYVAVTRAEERLIIVDDAAAAAEHRGSLALSDLKNRKGITGLVTAALEHEEGLNEGGLLEVHTIDFDEEELTEAVSGNKKPVEPIVRWQKETPSLPAIMTPSSLEQPAGITQSRILPPLSESSRGTSYGTLMHELAAALPDDQDWTEELIREYADPSLPDGAIRALLKFSESTLYQEARTMEIHKEYPFYYEDDTMRINGIMDFVAIGEDRIILLDFKTDRAGEEDIRAMYSPQLNAYRNVLSHFYPDHRIDAYAWSFHNNTAIQID